MRVWVYPEKTLEELGAERYQLSWEQVRESAKNKEELDHDADIVHYAEYHKEKETAVKRAREIVDSYKTAYGQVTVTRQVVGWFVEEDRVAEWQDTSDVEYVD